MNRETQNIAQKAPNSLEKPQQTRTSYSSVNWLFLVVALVVAILGTLLASTSLRGSIRGLSAVRPIYRAVNTLRSYTTPATASFQALIGGTSQSMPYDNKAKGDRSGGNEAKLTPAEEARWSKLADGMNMYHNHFRYEFDRVYTLADGGFHKEGMSLARFLREAQQLSQHLTMHHSIEAYIFPVLAKKMPQFKAGARESGEHLKSHKGIHDGLERYDKFVKDTLANTGLYNASALREIMDGFREVLFRHLDEEVRDLGGESLRAAGWTLAELRQIPM